MECLSSILYPSLPTVSFWNSSPRQSFLDSNILATDYWFNCIYTLHQGSPNGSSFSNSPDVIFDDTFYPCYAILYRSDSSHTTRFYRSYFGSLWYLFTSFWSWYQAFFVSISSNLQTKRSTSCHHCSYSLEFCCCTAEIGCRQFQSIFLYSILSTFLGYLFYTSCLLHR